MLSSLMGVLALASLSLSTPPVALPEHEGYLLHPHVGPRRAITYASETYCPRAGDILLFDHPCVWMNRVYWFCGTGGPLHAAVVFRRPDGSHAILEAGPNFVQKVVVAEVNPRLPEYDGSILVRRLKVPLTEEQSKQLTDFSLAQEGKGYALVRLLLQGTPLRARGKIRSHYLGRTSLERDRWMCSELVVAAMVAAGVFDAKEYRANTFYPRDLAYDDVHDISAFYERPAVWYPRPEPEFVGGAIRLRAAK